MSEETEYFQHQLSDLSDMIWDVRVQKSEEQVPEEWGLGPQHRGGQPPDLSQGQVGAQHLQTKLDKMAVFPVNVYNILIMHGSGSLASKVHCVYSNQAV